MATLDISAVKQEFLIFLRNSDVLSTTVRGVTNTQDTGSWSTTSTHLINRTNVKNIREITVDATPLVFGTDYTVDYSYNDSGTIKTQITLNSAQTGSYSIDYDYGSDKIWADLARNDLDLSSYPRVFFEVVSGTSREVTTGGSLVETELFLSVYVQDNNEGNIYTVLKTIRTAILAAKKGFFYLPFITPTNGYGPMLPTPNGKNKIVQGSMDFRCPNNFEE